MKIIVGNPGSGKTKELLALSQQKQIPILCESESRVERLLVKAQGYGFNNIPTPITLEKAKSVSTVLIDDVDRFFYRALGVNVEAITINRDTSVEVKDLDQK